MKTTDYIRSVLEDQGTGLKEHSLYDNRAHYKDRRPMHLAARRTNSIHDEERTVGNLRKHLAAALEALRCCPDDGPIALAEVDKAVSMFEALDHIDYFFPEVEAWCVFRTPDEEGHWDRIYCGCLTEE